MAEVAAQTYLEAGSYLRTVNSFVICSPTETEKDGTIRTTIFAAAHPDLYLGLNVWKSDDRESILKFEEAWRYYYLQDNCLKFVALLKKAQFS